MDTSWLDLESSMDDEIGTSLVDDVRSSSLKLKERVCSITICSMYVDRDSNIIRISTDRDVVLDLKVDTGTVLDPKVDTGTVLNRNDDHLTSVLPRERLQAMINDKRIVDSTQFHVECLLLYHVNLIPEQVQMYAKIDTDTRFLKVCKFASACTNTLPEFKDVVVPPAISCFHDVHRIYIIFREDSPMIQRSLTTQGCDTRSLTAKGCDTRSLTTQGCDTRSLTTQGCDPRSLTAKGCDPRSLTAKGCDTRSLTKRVSFHDTAGRSTGKHRHTRKFRTGPVLGSVSAASIL